MRSHNILTIPMGDFKFEGVNYSGEQLKRLLEEKLLNKETYSRRWRGRGKRKVHAIADGYSARGYDQDLPLDKSERQVLYVDVRPIRVKVDKRLQEIQNLDWEITSLKDSIEEIAEGRIELKKKAERMEAYQRTHMEKMQEAIRERTKLTNTVEEV